MRCLKVKNMPKCGIDLGSRFVKVAKESDGEIIFDLIDTVDFYKNYVRRDELGNFLLNLGFDSQYSITATGYGRNVMSFSNAEIISEIIAHFRGAKYQTQKNNFTLIDLGGQDSKIIKVKDGFIDDFIMNDKCAASTGRFLENVSNILKISLEELGNCIQDPVKLNSTCAIFSESEVIGKIAEGVKFSDIAAGVNESTAKRIAPMLKKLKSPEYFIAGGAGMFDGIKYFLQREIETEIKKLNNCQFNGAIGCIR